MKNNHTIREWKSFYISEFRAEEAWLSFMHSQGWKLQSIDGIGFHYTFEACDPEDWIYQLDFKEDGVAEDDYIQMYEDYGWELIQRFRHWFYFRKKKNGGDADDLSIFSDNASRIEMCRQIIRHHARLIFGMLGGFLMIAGLLTICFPQMSFAKGLLTGTIIGSCFGAMFIGNQFHRLNHMIR
ncbi:MAG: DUF2812 domain-containing protein, partial [Lachnospiraceae bacterium]|nr:DUF2812 domain-containing protein [Lachnospiraceae bacterium]